MMEIVDNAVLVRRPGAMAAGLADLLFWWSLAASLAIAFVVTVPVNRWLIARGKGHAVVHELHHAATTDATATAERPRHWRPAHTVTALLS